MFVENLIFSPNFGKSEGQFLLKILHFFIFFLKKLSIQFKFSLFIYIFFYPKSI